MILIDIRALGLTHHNKVVYQKFSIVFTNSPGFVKALIWVEGELLSINFKLLSLFLEHVSEGGFLVF